MTTYRYHLRRSLSRGLLNFRPRSLLDPQPVERMLLYVMVNPSTADDVTDDATIRKCRGFGSSSGECVVPSPFDAFEVVNLFAHRATDVRELLRESDAAENTDCIIGVHNDHWIRETARRASRIVVAWGAKSGRLGRLVRDRAERVVDILTEWHKQPLLCVGTSKSGDPLHPLMAKYGPFVPWKGYT